MIRRIPLAALAVALAAGPAHATSAVGDFDDDGFVEIRVLGIAGDAHWTAAAIGDVIPHPPRRDPHAHRQLQEPEAQGCRTGRGRVRCPVRLGAAATGNSLFPLHR